MPATLLDGRALSASIKAELQTRALEYRATHGHLARLALVIAGAHPAARLYGEQVARSCATIGLECISYTFPFWIKEEELRNAGNMMLGFPNFIPSTASAVRELLRASHIPLAGQHAVIIGRSNVGGKAVALLMLHQHATITICHSHTPNLAEITRTADILVVSTGRPKLITAEMVKPGAVVLDAGINDVDGHIVGDVDFAGVSAVASSITPVPGGLGPLTNLMLIRHTLVGPEVE
jgi:methylenetetrahydrofolate dehydrogenase (NADP+)/methenyltetrahydrofolate cyclohydrolase